MIRPPFPRLKPNAALFLTSKRHFFPPVMLRVSRGFLFFFTPTVWPFPKCGTPMHGCVRCKFAHLGRTNFFFSSSSVFFFSLFALLLFRFSLASHAVFTRLGRIVLPFDRSTNFDAQPVQLCIYHLSVLTFWPKLPAAFLITFPPDEISSPSLTPHRYSGDGSPFFSVKLSGPQSFLGVFGCEKPHDLRVVFPPSHLPSLPVLAAQCPGRGKTCFVPPVPRD